MGLILVYDLDFFREYSNMKGMEKGTFYIGIVPSFPPYGTVLIVFIEVTRKDRILFENNKCISNITSLSNSMLSRETLNACCEAELCLGITEYFSELSWIAKE